jgi:molybdate transport system substrate-binding protein
MKLQEAQLRIFSAGAVAPPLQEATVVFEARSNVQCSLKIGKPSDLFDEIASSKEGDIISCGAEFILDDAEDQGLIVRDSRRTLGFRRSVIIVPADNSAEISSLDDLCRKNIRIGIAVDGCLKGIWDEIASKAGLTDLLRQNITHHADACGSLMNLINNKRVDAVFGWNAFAYVWPRMCEAIELPSSLQVYRSTAAAVLTYSKNTSLSEKFLDFLTSNEGKEIYSDYGWIQPSGFSRSKES